MKEMIEFVLTEQGAGRPEAAILDSLEAVFGLTDRQAHAIYRIAGVALEAGLVQGSTHERRSK